MKNETMTNAARTYSPAIYLAALRHSAGTAAARGAETRRETARRAGAVRLTIAAVLQGAEDAAARRAPAPDPETIAAAIAPETAAPAPRPRFDIGEIARAASADYAEMLTIDPSARSLPLWYHCLRSAAADLKAETAAGTIAEYLRLPGEKQFETLRRAAARVPVWSARAARRVDPDRAADLLPSARWTIYASGTRTGSGSADDREIVFQSTRDYRWIDTWTREGRRADALDTIAGETWARIAARAETGRIAPADPAWLTIYRESLQAAAGIGRSLRDAPSRQKADAPSLDDPAFSDAARYPSPEAETIAREEIAAAARNDLDRIALRGTAYGWTQEETAAAAAAVQSLDALRAAGYEITPAVAAATIAAAPAAVNRSTIARRLRAMVDRLREAGTLRPETDPGYWSGHNPGPAPIASPAITREAREIVTDPARIAAAREIVPAPAPAPRTAPAVPVPSVMPAPAVLPRPAWRTRPAAPAPAPAHIADPETMTPADIMRRVHAHGSPEAETLRRAAALRAEYDRRDAIAARSLDRLRAAREAETAARIAAAAARAAAPVKYDDPDPETLRRRETLRRARETIAAAAKARRERIAREIARERSAR